MGDGHLGLAVVGRGGAVTLNATAIAAQPVSAATVFADTDRWLAWFEFI
jgi:hypothetical protein